MKNCRICKSKLKKIINLGKIALVGNFSKSKSDALSNFNEYKKESFDYFDEMLSNQNERVLKTLFNIKLVSDNNSKTNNEDFTSKKESQEPRRIITKKIGRNEPCPCGSGKKYKQCHGR